MHKYFKNTLLSVFILVVGYQQSIAMQKPPARSRVKEVAPPPTHPSTKKWEFSNQSNQMATMWVWQGHRCWIPYSLSPERDSGIINPTEEGGTNYIYTSSGFFLLTKHHQTLRLVKEVATGPGRAESRTIREMPWSETTDILIIVSPDGSVDFAKRNR